MIHAATETVTTNASVAFTAPAPGFVLIDIPAASAGGWANYADTEAGANGNQSFTHNKGNRRLGMYMNEGQELWSRNVTGSDVSTLFIPMPGVRTAWLAERFQNDTSHAFDDAVDAAKFNPRDKITLHITPFGANPETTTWNFANGDSIPLHNGTADGSRVRTLLTTWGEVAGSTLDSGGAGNIRVDVIACKGHIPTAYYDSYEEGPWPPYLP